MRYTLIPPTARPSAGTQNNIKTGIKCLFSFFPYSFSFSDTVRHKFSDVLIFTNYVWLFLVIIYPTNLLKLLKCYGKIWIIQLEIIYKYTKGMEEKWRRKQKYL